ncbi:uncharacterized protein Triagg1_10777 [Trichoderma aggressivum f. europaeum]|uniref:Uncharacterized protein n=1 Tax=Trichoderma aggressivum f. europaeum TaxID=173218 RepID=A0AAE1LW37_9HYPO|nr:hypothetical protein Triagg1_10777 [Trichoderma aggressivum f. europaeum]
MKKAAPATNAARDAASHDHMLQGGHAIMKDDPEDFTTSKASENMSKQSGLGGSKPSNMQGSAGTGDSMRQRDTQSHDE